MLTSLLEEVCFAPSIFHFCEIGAVASVRATCKALSTAVRLWCSHSCGCERGGVFMDLLAIEFARIGNQNGMRSLLADGAVVVSDDENPAPHDEYDKTALEYAIIRGDRDMVQLLLENGASPCQTNRLGTPMMHLAAERGHTSLFGLLRRAGADIEVRVRGETALMMAAGWGGMHMSDGAIPVIQELLREGADVNSQNNRGQTALMMAAQWGKRDAVGLLLRSGADPNMRDNDGKTALIWTLNPPLFYYHLETRPIIQDLVAHGADVDIKDKVGASFASIARRRGYRYL